MARENYLQFELCLLGGPFVDEEVMKLILARGIGVFAKTLTNAEVERYTGRADAPEDFDPSEPAHKRMMAAADQLGLSVESVEALLQRENVADSFVNAFSSRPDTTVRVKTAFALEVINGGRLNFRRFCVLCGIYSAIGDKRYYQLTLEQIQARAAGFRAITLQNESRPGGTFLTTKQVRSTVAWLFSKRFFARATYRRRCTYYSIRMRQPDLTRTVQGFGRNRRLREENDGVRTRHAPATMRATQGQLEGNLNKNSFNKNEEIKTSNTGAALSAARVWFLDPLEYDGMLAAWNEHLGRYDLSSVVQRKRLALMANALKKGVLTHPELLDALTISNGTNEGFLIRACSGKVPGYKGGLKQP